jgi:hypothetical protein
LRIAVQLLSIFERKRTVAHGDSGTMYDPPQVGIRLGEAPFLVLPSKFNRSSEMNL